MKLEPYTSYLEEQQLANGSFIYDGSKQTVFLTSLILECLHNVPGTARLRKQMADFLLRQRSESWSWNYWQLGSEAAEQYPYPDDLDDTTCALVGLQHFDARLIDGQVLGYLAQHLSLVESAPGGPYGTWLIDRQALPEWYDIDPAVNANIGYLLALQQVTLPGLEQYFAKRLASGELQSSYYVSQVPTLYFLARWYRGSAYKQMQKLVNQGLQTALQNKNALHLAMLLTAARHLQAPRTMISRAAERLKSLAAGDHWPASDLYLDPTIHGIKQYAGSAALTTAFALEALIVDQLPSVMSNRSAEPINIERLVNRLSRAITQPDLRRRYRRFAHQLIAQDTDQQVSGLATLTALACGKSLIPKTLTALNLASLHGWVAYTIYDDIWDDEAKKELLGVANVALRQTLQQFQSSLPGREDFFQLVNQILTIVDGANTWEVLNGRANRTDDILYINRLPDYGTHNQLAERSLGHSLAAHGVLLAYGHELGSPEQQALQSFFRHYLIARQLNDDAHDWEVDLERGHLTAVVTLLLEAHGTYRRLKLSQVMPGLRQLFWNTVLDEVAGLIDEHIQRARQALIACPFKDNSIYESWLVQLERVTEQALHERGETQKFITSFSVAL